MAKDIVLRDDDYIPSYLNGVKRIRTELQSGGLQTWVPEDELFDVAEKKITKNGTYVAAEDDVEGYSVVTVDVEGGGGGGEGGRTGRIADVIFYDYDGTPVYTYSKEQFLKLEEMPVNPSHAGLTAQGWNWSFERAHNYVEKYGMLDVGQMYITDDGTTRIYIHLEKGRTSPMLGVCPNGSVDVDWGDGTTHDTLTGTSTTTVKWTPNHEYAAPGDYVIKLAVSGEMGFSGEYRYGGCLLNYSSLASDTRNSVYRNSIKGAVIGSSVTSIGNCTFYNCYSLSSVIIPDSVTSIGNYAFYNCHSLSSVIMPDGVTSIEYYNFYNCRSLSSVIIPDSVASIGYYTFYNCSSLSSIIIPDGVISIEQHVFDNCSLSSVIIPDGVTSIEEDAFNSCHSLSSVTIPDSVVSIGNYAFIACYSLSSVTIPDSVTSIGEGAFYYCYSLSSVIIPDGVTSIEENAFNSCYSLSSVTIPDSVTSIGEGAFYYCYSLSSIIIPDGVTSIGTYTFYSCYSLSSVTIPDSVTSIGKSVFYDCYSLSSIIIPDGVTSIGEYAFNNCSLSSVIIPDGVASIGAAFYYCPSLGEIHFKRVDPPSASSNSFSGVPTDCKIYVPTGSIEAYKSAANYPDPNVYTYIEE